MKTKFFKTLFVLLISLPFGEGWGGVLMAQNLTVCRAASYSVPSAVAATGASSYEWLENGKVIPDVTGVSYTNAAGKTEAGTYVYVRRAYLQSCGEWQNSNDFVVYVAGTMPVITVSASAVCQNTDVVFTASGGGSGATYTWTGASTGTASGTGNCSYTVSGATTGTKSVTAYATAPSNGVNCVSATSGAATATVTALPATPTVTRVSAGTVCQNTDVVFTASGGGSGATYTWTGASTGTASGTGNCSYTVSGATTGTKSVTAYATAPSNGVNCVSATSGAATATVSMPPAAPTSLSSNVSTICNGVSTAATLTASGGSAGSGAVYEWGTGSTVGSSVLTTTTGSTYSVSPSAATTYWVRLKGTGACSVTTTGGVTVSIGTYTSISAGSITTASATTTPNTNPNVTVQSSATASGGSGSYTYQWRRTGTSSATLIGSDATYALSSDAANYSTAGTYYFNRYAKDATCNTSWVASANSYTLTLSVPMCGIAYSTGGVSTSYAASANMWVIGGLTWSDRIVVSPSNCTYSATFTTSNYTTKEYKMDASTGVNRYYYSWSCATGGSNGGTNTSLCPSGWRLPSQSDFTKIKDNCTGLGIIAAWGLGGYVRENLINSTASDATYWSSTEYDVQGNNNAYDLGYYNNNVRVGNYLAKYYGHQVRCVKN